MRAHKLGNRVASRETSIPGRKRLKPKSETPDSKLGIFDVNLETTAGGFANEATGHPDGYLNHLGHAAETLSGAWVVAYPQAPAGDLEVRSHQKIQSASPHLKQDPDASAPPREGMRDSLAPLSEVGHVRRDGEWSTLNLWHPSQRSSI